MVVDRRIPPAVAAGLAALLEPAAAERHRAAARRAAGELTWSTERERLLDVYRAVLARRAALMRAVLLVRNTCRHDSRVLREARTLREAGWEVQLIGVVSTEDPEREIELGGLRVRRLAPGARLRSLRRPPAAAPAGGDGEAPAGAAPAAGLKARLGRWYATLDYYRVAFGAVRALRPDLLHCNDYNTMWVGVAARAALGTAVVYDAHELWADRNGRVESRAWLVACEMLFVRAAHRVLTTSEGYAAVMARRYRTATPLVVRNLPDRAAPPGDGRGPGTEPTAIYLGALTSHRGLEQAVAAIAALPCRAPAPRRSRAPGLPGRAGGARARARGRRPGPDRRRGVARRGRAHGARGGRRARADPAGLPEL